MSHPCVMKMSQMSNQVFLLHDSLHSYDKWMVGDVSSFFIFLALRFSFGHVWPVIKNGHLVSSYKVMRLCREFDNRKETTVYITDFSDGIIWLLSLLCHGKAQFFVKYFANHINIVLGIKLTPDLAEINWRTIYFTQRMQVQRKILRVA